MNRTRHFIAWAFLIALCSSFSAWPDDAPGAPGIPHFWPPALKQAIGTAYEPSGAASPLWFTIAQGIVTEIFYPRVDTPQVSDIQFLASDGVSFFSEQKRDVISDVRYDPAGAAIRITGRDRSGRYSLTEDVVSDPAQAVLRIRAKIHVNGSGLHFYVLFKPALGGHGEQNQAEATDTALTASGESPAGQKFFATLQSSVPWRATSAGYTGTSDGWQELSKNFALKHLYKTAGPGNVALIGELNLSEADLQKSDGVEVQLTLVLSTDRPFTQRQQPSFEDVLKQYNDGWAKFVAGLSPWVSSDNESRLSAITIKMHEDKNRRGALVASLSTPAIPDSQDAPGDIAGYHLVWPRDLYHSAMGLLAAGDVSTPRDILAFYRASQRSDGSWSQNFYVDGTRYWPGLQMDEVSFPILLAWQLKKHARADLSSADLSMIKRAAEFIANNGPRSPQDRWEEIGGYIPNTMAVELAALRVASALLGDSHYADVAASWNASLDRWTLVRNGSHGANYYLRCSPSGQPESSEWIEIANSGGWALSSDLLDGGFLDLVRLGTRPALDASIRSTLTDYTDPSQGVCQPVNGAIACRRYSRDAYGPGHQGGFWPILAGELGHYAILTGDMNRARAQLALMQSSALPSGLIPEQLSDPARPAAADLGVASPLVWSHAEFLSLRRSIQDGIVFDAP